MFLTKISVGLCLVLAAVHIQRSQAAVEQLEHLPDELQKYLDTLHTTGDLTEQSGRLLFWASINQFISKFVESGPELLPEQETYLRECLEDAIYPVFMYGSNVTHYGERVKRQAGPARRVRREIRTMTVNERFRYFNAVNRMKTDTSLPPNVYDFLAAYHTGENIGRAHFGPAFPSWHRLYLWIYEYFLRLQDPTVTVPFWASVLDDAMPDSAQTVLFTPGFFGNPDGVIRTGPFGNWPQINPQTSFSRNVRGGELFTYAGVERVLRRRRNADILIPTAQADSNFELQHGAGHVFVSGDMNNLNRAARDPIFFSHHSFVDQIWQRFRNNQRRSGINPQTDYPFDANDPRFRPQHSPSATAGFTGLGGAETWTQSLGYINAFDNLVFYEDVPECPSCGNSPYLYCSFTMGRCVSRSRNDMRGRPDVQRFTPPGGRVARQATQDSSWGVCQKWTLFNDVDTKWMQRSYLPPGSPMYTWAYIPVKVVIKRPPEYHGFEQYSLYNQVSHAPYSYKDELYRGGSQKRCERCFDHLDTVGKITIVSRGLNYGGCADESVLLDNRLPVSEGKVAVPVKMPLGSESSEVILAAFDPCGRACKPLFKKASYDGTVTDSKFSGGIKVTYSQPEQFSHSYSEAYLNMWDVHSPSSCPTQNDHDTMVTFYCDYTDPWIWEPTQGSQIWSEFETTQEGVGYQA
uniref:Tyrosinase n=1 Tax=Meretrix meretrix TaxID=291251 RepID=A0A1L1ZLS6_MERMT|nr:tyrosinase [Meretrix meretrix]